MIAVALGQRARGAPFPSNVTRVPDFQPGLMSTLSVSCGRGPAQRLRPHGEKKSGGTPDLLQPLQLVRRSNPQQRQAGGCDGLRTHNQMQTQKAGAARLHPLALPAAVHHRAADLQPLGRALRGPRSPVGSRSSPAKRPGAGAQGAAAGGWGGRPPGRAPPACRSRHARWAHPCARSCRACRPCRPRARRRRRRSACRQSRPACRACRPCPACRRRPRRPCRRTALRPRPLRPPAVKRAAAQPGHAADRRPRLLQALGHTVCARTSSPTKRGTEQVAERVPAACAACARRARRAPAPAPAPCRARGTAARGAGAPPRMSAKPCPPPKGLRPPKNCARRGRPCEPGPRGR